MDVVTLCRDICFRNPSIPQHAVLLTASRLCPNGMLLSCATLVFSSKVAASAVAWRGYGYGVLHNCWSVWQFVIAFVCCCIDKLLLQACVKQIFLQTRSCALVWFLINCYLQISYYLDCSTFLPVLVVYVWSWPFALPNPLHIPL